MAVKQLQGAFAPDGSAYTTQTDGAGNLVSAATPVLGAGSAIIGKVGIDQTTPGATNAVSQQSSAGTLVATTIATGGTAQLLFSATPANGFEVINPSGTEILYIRENGTAAVAGATSLPIAPYSSYCTPTGYKPTGDVSIIAATTAHAVIGRRW